MYEEGKGLTQDHIRARMWFNLASSQGNRNVEESLNRTDEWMQTSQIVYTQRMAQDCEKNIRTVNNNSKCVITL
jgi:TPR repeat protein